MIMFKGGLKLVNKYNFIRENFKIDDENHDIARYLSPSKENKQKSFFVFLLFLNKQYMHRVYEYCSKNTFLRWSCLLI